MTGSAASRTCRSTLRSRPRPPTSRRCVLDTGTPLDEAFVPGGRAPPDTAARRGRHGRAHDLRARGRDRLGPPGPTRLGDRVAGARHPVLDPSRPGRGTRGRAVDALGVPPRPTKAALVVDRTPHSSRPRPTRTAGSSRPTGSAAWWSARPGRGRCHVRQPRRGQLRRRPVARTSAVADFRLLQRGPHLADRPRAGPPLTRRRRGGRRPDPGGPAALLRLRRPRAPHPAHRHRRLHRDAGRRGRAAGRPTRSPRPWVATAPSSCARASS